MSRFYKIPILIAVLVFGVPAVALAAVSAISTVQERNSAQANIEGLEFDYNNGPGLGSLYLKFFDGDPSSGEPFGLRLIPSGLALDKTETANNAPYNTAVFEVIGTVAANFLKAFRDPSIGTGAPSGQIRFDGTKFQWRAEGGATWNEFGSALTESDPVFGVQKGQPGGVATLGADSKVPSSQLPALVITDVFVLARSDVDTLGERTALGIEQGDVIIDTAAEKTYIWDGSTWQEIIATNTVMSVNGDVGTVVLGLSDLNDVAISSLAADQILQWNGTAWINSALPISSQWVDVTGGILYSDGNVGIGTALTELLYPLTVQGDVAAGGFVTAGTVDAGSVIVRGGNVTAQATYSDNWKYVPRDAALPGAFSLGHTGPRCVPTNTAGKVNCDTNNLIQDCGDAVYDIGPDPGTAVATCYDYYQSLAGADERRAYDIVSAVTSGGWVNAATAYSDTISIGGDSSGNDAEVRINAPDDTRNRVSFTNPNISGGLADIRARQGFFQTLIIPGGAPGQVLGLQADGTAAWQSAGAGSTIVEHDGSLTGNGSSASPLGIVACVADGEVLRWDGATSSWLCSVGGGGGADNLGDHTATQNIRLGNFWLSGDGGNEGLRVTSAGSIGIGTANPTGIFEIQNNTFPGTVSIGNGATLVGGTGTQFLTSFKSGDTITVAGGGSRVVNNVSSNTELSVTFAFSTTLIDATYSGAPNPNFPAFIVNGNGNTEIGGGLLVNQGGYFGGILQLVGGLRLGTGTQAGYVLTADDETGNASWQKAPKGEVNHDGTLTGDSAITLLGIDITAETTRVNTLADARIGAQKGVANGLATLDGNSKIPSSQLPQLVVTDVLVQPFSAVDTAGERTALGIEQGDVVIDTAAEKTYIWDGTTWQQIIAPNTVTSVNGETGTVVLGVNNLVDANIVTPQAGDILQWTDTTPSVENLADKIYKWVNTQAGVFSQWQAKLEDTDGDEDTPPVETGIFYTTGNVGIGTSGGTSGYKVRINNDTWDGEDVFKTSNLLHLSGNGADLGTFFGLTSDNGLTVKNTGIDTLTLKGGSIGIGTQFPWGSITARAKMPENASGKLWIGSADVSDSLEDRQTNLRNVSGGGWMQKGVAVKMTFTDDASATQTVEGVISYIDTARGYYYISDAQFSGNFTTGAGGDYAATFTKITDIFTAQDVDGDARVVIDSAGNLFVGPDLVVGGATTLTGNVGIGTAPSAAKLDIVQTGDQAKILRLGIERDWCFMQEGSGASAALKLSSNCGGSNNNKNFLIETTGRTTLGGTLSVTGASTLTGNTSVGGTLRTGGQIFLSGASSGNEGGQITFEGGASNADFYLDNYAGRLRLVSGGAERFSVRPDGNTTVGGTLGVTGNVGIGIAPGTEKLKVSGTANITGDTTVGGTLYATGDVYADDAVVGTGLWHGGDWSGFSHSSMTGSGKYAIMQNNNGRTLVNSASGQELALRINNSTKLSISADGNTTVSGTLTVDGTDPSCIGNLCVESSNDKIIHGSNLTPIYETVCNTQESSITCTEQITGYGPRYKETAFTKNADDGACRGTPVTMPSNLSIGDFTCKKIGSDTKYSYCGGSAVDASKASYNCYLLRVK